MKPRKLALIVALNLGAIALILVAVEFVMRTVEPTAPPLEDPLTYMKPQAGESLFVLGRGRVRTNPQFLPKREDPDQRGYVTVDLPHPKPEHARRIVLVGSSPMRGGTQPGQSTADSLQREMNRVAPTGGYEVIDASLPQGFADNVAWTLTQLAPLEPDLIVIWPAAAPVIFADMEQALFGDSGARGNIAGLLESTRTYEALRAMLHNTQPAAPPRPGGAMREDPAAVDPELHAFMRRLGSAAAQAYARFLATALETAGGYRARALVLVPPTCLACMPPLFSLHDAKLSAADAVRFAEHLAAGEQAESAGRHAEAAIALDQAVQIDPTYAKARFLLGSTYRELGRIDEARAELQAAVQYDASVESIKEPPDASTRQIAAEAGALLFDLENFVTDHSPGGIPDGRAMIDLTHLSLDMQAQAAKALAAFIDENWVVE
jgi:tetratricopeptide (TPR) repeat protein